MKLLDQAQFEEGIVKLNIEPIEIRKLIKQMEGEMSILGSGQRG